MSAHVLLDGKLVPSEAVTPDKARFIGMWRPPACPFENARGFVLCACGAMLEFATSLRQHYAGGCFDLPQYVSLNPEDPRGYRCPACGHYGIPSAIFNDCCTECANTRRAGELARVGGTP